MDEPSEWLGRNHRVVGHGIPYALKMALEIQRLRNTTLKGIQRGFLTELISEGYRSLVSVGVPIPGCIC
jgi:hypothetical protein